MENEVVCMRFKELKEVVASLENNPVINDETKIFLNTGWDSIQEILPEAISVENAQLVWVEDPLTLERFPGYSLQAKETAFETTAETEPVIVIKNLY
ncbi:hypothetical protein [Enterococcus diestrammenae]|uniref:hypothetical protein n=1 Tax=Enterococcus diestrammenae TaxID=1155073 RepID=UPI00195CCA3C|nr:hypothetical protein [Enterococcus diestrammenae]